MFPRIKLQAWKTNSLQINTKKSRYEISVRSTKNQRRSLIGILGTKVCELTDIAIVLSNFLGF